MARRYITSICEHCGVEFLYRFRGKNYHSRYCSPACRNYVFGLAKRRSYLDRMQDILRTFTDPAACWDWPQSTNASGYGIITVRHSHRTLAHRAAWEVVNGPIPDGLSVLHRCDRTICINAINHLFLGTQADNMRDMIGKDRGNRGERHGNSRLTDDIVRSIRAATGTQDAIAERFGVARSNVSIIRARITWRHIE